MSSTAMTGNEFLERQRNRRKMMGMTLRFVLIGLAIFYALFPVVWIFSVSINPGNNIIVDGVIPSGATSDFYNQLLDSDLYPFLTWLWNSIKIATITMLISVSVSMISAYSFSRFRFSGRQATLLTVFLVQIFPNSLSIVGTFLLIEQLGDYIPELGLNAHGGIILVYLGGAMGINTWLMKGFFDSIPRELDESARIDGASHWTTLRVIIFPLVRPILAVVGILTFISAYNDYIIALTLLKDSDQQTLAVGLNLFIGDTHSDWGLFAAGALMGAIPIVVLYLIMQDYIVGGLPSGAVKG